jgi:hypothetical protein
MSKLEGGNHMKIILYVCVGVICLIVGYLVGRHKK